MEKSDIKIPPYRSNISPDPVRILLIEDNRADAYLIETLLKEKGSAFQIIWAERLEKGIAVIKEKEVDIILLDLSLPDSFGAETFQKVSAAAPHTPIVLLTGLNDDAFALEMMRLGAQDYLVKGEIESATMLARVIRYAVERKRSEEKMKQIAAELAESNQKLLALDEMKTKFIAIASHELKTPLTIMKGFIGLLIEDCAEPVSETRGEHLDLIKGATDRMKRMVDSLLDISKMELGQMPMKLNEKNNIKKLVQQTVNDFKPQAKLKDIAIKEELTDDLKEIFGDNDRIRQVIDNLISNALKYTPRGGEILVCTKNLSNGIEITVKDTGIGIPEADQERIFEPFQHLRKSGLEGEESTGLGLALVRKIVEAHGGTINVQSSPQKGSVFSVFLPNTPPKTIS